MIDGSIPGASRVLELATDQAKFKHWYASIPGASGDHRDHRGDFETCSSPDCVLVRAFPVRETAPAKMDMVTMTRELLKELSVGTFLCKARASAADPPQECDWPRCGCDPYADKVIGALQESAEQSRICPLCGCWPVAPPVIAAPSGPE